MPVEVHSEGLKRRYIASCLSVACLLNLLILAGAAILPLYIVYVSRLWIVQEYRFEQPAVAYQSSLVVQLQGLRGPSTGYRAPFTAIWSTSPAANDLLGNGVVRGMVLRTSMQDHNHDGLNDVFRLTVSMPLASDETIHGATVVAYMTAGYTVRWRAGQQARRAHRAPPLASPPATPPHTPPPLATQGAASLQMDAFLSHSFSSGVPGQRLVVDGDLALHQRAPLPRMGGAAFRPYLASPLPPLASALSAAAASPEGLLASAAGRNYSLRFTPAAAPVWVPDGTVPGPLADAASALATQPRSFQLQLTARVPLGPLLVTPSIPEELKWGWVQYVALLAVSAPVAWVLRRVLFGMAIVETTVLADAPRSMVKLHAS